MRRAFLPACAAALLMFALPAHAAARPQLTDAVGDANGLNDQNGVPLSNRSTAPASVAGADIVSVRFATVFKKVGRAKVPSGFTVTMQLSDGPMDDVMYTVTADVPTTCDRQYTMLGLTYAERGVTRSTIAHCADPADTGSAHSDVLVGVEADTSKHTLTWTLKGMKPGATVENITAQTSVFVLGVFDEAVADRTYTYGK